MNNPVQTMPQADIDTVLVIDDTPDRCAFWPTRWKPRGCAS
jgi:hypothetical protein